MRSAAVQTGTQFHELDHIAPLAALCGMPLLIAEEANFEMCRRFYPQTEARHVPDIESQLGFIADEFDALVECKYWTPQLKHIFKTLYKKEMRLVFCPHGQSDKGYRAPLLDPYAWQDQVLVYGELMIRMLKDLGVWEKIQSYSVVGNYRLKVYEANRPFYDRLAKEAVPLSSGKKTLLYAPTWNDADGASSFFFAGGKVIEELPSDWNLILKVHPLLEQRDPSCFYRIAALAEQKPNAFLVHEFPPVYPLLAMADAYLGDASSVGYDFLYFQRPMFFFPTKPPSRLHSCGKVLDPTKNLYAQLDEPNLCVKEQKALYGLAFEADVPVRFEAFMEM